MSQEVMNTLVDMSQEIIKLKDQKRELLEALKCIEARVSYYAGLAEGEAPNIEQWAYTDASRDMAIVRAAIAKAEGEKA